MNAYTRLSARIGTNKVRPANLLAATACVGLSLLGACSRKAEAPRQPPVPAVVASVESKNVPFEITGIGRVEAFTTVEVKSRVGGELKQVYFQEGQDVRKGEPLFLIDPAPYQAALEGTKANLARDSALAANAGENVRRYADLVKKDYITLQQYDDMLASAEALKATVKGDRAALENSGLNLGYCSITAPVSGRTGSLLVHPGNVVKANPDNPMLVILQIQPVYVSFTVPEQYLSEILQYSSGQKLKVRAYSPGEEQDPRVGELSFINNTVDTATGTILLKALFPNEDKALWPGEFVNVELVLKTLENAVVVPSQAVQTGQNGQFVFTVNADLTVESRPVTISYNLRGESIIGQGLKPGEKVVTDGQLRLYPGARIEETTGLNNGKAGNP